MPFPPVPNVVEVELRATIDSQHVENRIMVDVGAAPTNLLMTSVGGIVVSWIGAEYNNLCNQNLTFTEVVVRDKSVADGLELSFPVNTAGLDASAPYPNETSFCLSLRSGLSGRSRRGRIYLFPPSTSYVLPPNRVTNVYRDGAIASVQQLMNDFDSEGFSWAVVSYISGGVARVTPLVTRLISVIAVDNLLDSQRGRKPGNGS